MTTQKLLYVDVETTGVDAKRNGIVQIAWIIEIDGEAATESSFVVNPPEWAEIEPEALKVHGISEDEFRQGLTYREVHDKLEADMAMYVDRYERSDKFKLSGYNVRFDFDFLKRLWEESGDKYLGAWIQFGQFVDPFGAVPIWQLAGIVPSLPNLKLATVAGAFGVTDVDGAHDALEDLHMTRKIVNAMKTEFRRMWVVPEG